MKSPASALQRLLLAVSILAVASVPLEAKPAKRAPAKAPAAAPAKVDPDVPWLYRGSDVPQDKEWKFGELANGLRYAVRKNGVPPGQVSIRIRVDAGSMNETDEERGFAHLIEHLVFRQSKYLGEAQAIPTWQRLGATFGSDTNAETTPIGTTYKIDLPDATNAGLEESFKLLSGMMIAPTLSQANIHAELPIVLAEKRERGGPAQRIDEAMRETIYAGQLLSVRAPIGTEQTLTNATQEAVRAFHKRWYRPENTVVIVAGDADPTLMKQLIEKWFSDWPVEGKPVPAPNFGDPVLPASALKVADASLPPVGEARVLVEPQLPAMATWAVLRPWRPVNDTIVYNQGLMIDALAQSIINRRLENQARAGGSFLTAQVAQQDVSRSADATFVSVTPLGDDWKAAVNEVRATIAQALAAPPSQAEIDREVAEIRVTFASSAEQRTLQPSAKLADDLGTALDIRETVAAPDAVLQIFDRSAKLFTPAAVLKHTRQLFAGTVTRAVLITPKAGSGDEGALRSALATPVSGVKLAGQDDKPLSFAQLPPLGAPTQPSNVTPTGIAEIEQLDFANGVKAQIWPSDFEPGRVTVKVRFGAGYRAFRSEDAVYAQLGKTALIQSGVGPLDQNGLDRITTGRKMGWEFDIDDAEFTFAAATRREDLADQLYLFAAKLQDPRWDANPVQRAKAAARLGYEAYEASPQAVLERDLKWLERDRDPRYRVPSPVEVEAATPEGFRAVWEPILKSGPIEVQVFGDINKAETIAALSRTFGALKPRPPLPAGTAPATLKVPEGGSAPVVLTHRGDPGQAAAMVYWPTGGGSAGLREGRQLRILAEVFSNRLLDKLRENLGAAYAPQVAAQWPVDLDKGGAIFAMAQLQPKDVPVFYATADQIAADLIARPPTADELERVTEPLRQQITRAFSGSAYFMYQLEGATSDPSRYQSLRSLMPDSTRTTPEAMQALAARYLLKGKSWRLAVIPAGQALAGQPGPQLGR